MLFLPTTSKAQTRARLKGGWNEIEELMPVELPRLVCFFDYLGDHCRVGACLSPRRAGHSMNARTNGRTSAPNGIIMISDSQGGNPAFLQMNQNGRTPTTATITATIKIITNSGIPIGPIIFVFVRFGFKFLRNSAIEQHAVFIG